MTLPEIDFDIFDGLYSICWALFKYRYQDLGYETKQPKS